MNVKKIYEHIVNNVNLSLFQKYFYYKKKTPIIQIMIILNIQSCTAVLQPHSTLLITFASSEISKMFGAEVACSQRSDG